MEYVIDVAFVVAVTAFFRERLQLKSYKVLACAFGVALLFNFAPLISATLPAIAPWLDAVVKTIWLFVVSAGSVDLVSYFQNRS